MEKFRRKIRINNLTDPSYYCPRFRQRVTTFLPYFADLLLIFLTRYKFDNDARYDAHVQLAKTVKQLLGLDGAPADDQRFLQTTLQDYVILTRQRTYDPEYSY
ncbi:MAG: hypothetical protein DI538_15125 [Azospira oryzae]|jgi:hypothetical protein|nr:MAG: hypothetical protein DI538_15125 [Azospira oryzae]